MSERPQLSLGQPPDTLHRKLGTVPRGWLLVIVLLNLALLGGVAVLLVRPASTAARAVPAATPGSPAELKAVAQDLEDKSLDAEAARAWDAYLAAEPQEAGRAEIQYRIGRLYMQAEQFGPAAAALVRAEHAAAGDRDLQAKIGPRIVECLGRLGRYGEMGRELSRRVEVGGKDQTADKGSKRVLATLAGQELTEADLDRMIERRVDHILALQGGGEPQQRQSVLQQMSAPSARRQLLQELLRTELFCRRARDLGLDRDENFRQARDELSRNLLAEQFLMRELEKIRATEVDLESYFKANVSQYETPESLQVVTLRLEEKEDPAALLEKIRSADDFRKLAGQRRPAGADAKGLSQNLGRRPSEPVASGSSEMSSKIEGRQVVRGRNDPELGDVEPLATLGEGEWTKQAHKRGKDRFLVLVEKKTPRQTPRLQDVLRQVRADYVARKQQEMAERLFADLTQRYDVRILPDAPPKPGADGPAQGDSKPTSQSSAKP